MDNYRVSVLLTFYNQEKYVDQAIKSIINQKTDFGVKIIIGDDGSSDNTCNVVRQWQEKYPEIIELHVMKRKPGKHIAGFRASRNRLNLLQYVDTEYFIYLDGDDYYVYDEKLQKQVEILDKPENRDCIACGHNTDMLYLDGRREPITSIMVKEGKYDPQRYWNKLYFHTDTLLIRSQVISRIDKKLLENNFNDNMITFAIIQYGNLYYIPERWTIYLQTGDGIWTSGKKIVNNIRNMFIYDLCNIINPDMKRETRNRFAFTWLELFKLRKHIYSCELREYSREVGNKRLVNSYYWIHYNDLKLSKKIILWIKFFNICWEKVGDSIKYKISIKI